MAKHDTIFKSCGMYSLEELKEYAKENLIENGHGEEDITYDYIADEIRFHEEMEFEDAETNLDKTLNGRVLCIASLGLWNGKKSGYKILDNNLNEVVTCDIGCDEKEVYCDGYNVLAKGYHHDGSNYVEFREIREDKDIDKLLDKIYNNEEITRKELNRYTRSLRPHVKQIYGF